MAGSDKHLKFCILNLETSKAWSPVDFGQMFQSGLQKLPAAAAAAEAEAEVERQHASTCHETWVHCNVALGDELPEDILSFQGVVLTGSHFNIRDAYTPDSTIKVWFDKVVAFIRQASDRGSPRIYGGCFGTQVIAVALGGEVGLNPDKHFVLKAESIRLCVPPSRILEICHHSEIEDDAHMLNVESAANQQSLRIIVSHGDCVTKLPPGAELIGTSPSCSNEIYVTGCAGNIMGAQSHPEFDFKYCIADRIWPAVVETKQRLTPSEIDEAKASFNAYSKDDGQDAQLLLKMISAFLRASIDERKKKEQ